MAIHTTPLPGAEHDVRLDQHDSVRMYVCRRLRNEVAQLELRIETLKDSPAPHAPIMISTYQRMVDRKKGFMQSWNLKCLE